MLLASTLTAVLCMPDLPHRHTSDPSYLGIVGFVFIVGLLIRRTGQGWGRHSANRRVIVFFLVALPLIYLANWMKFGGSMLELGVQVAGLGIWIFFAYRAVRMELFLWLGCVLHAVWDAAHFGRVEFIPEWYAAACIAADLGLGAFVFLNTRGVPEASADDHQEVSA